MARMPLSMPTTVEAEHNMINICERILMDCSAGATQEGWPG
jgi:hypothetical protein